MSTNRSNDRSLYYLILLYKKSIIVIRFFIEHYFDEYVVLFRNCLMIKVSDTVYRWMIYLPMNYLECINNTVNKYGNS